VATKVPWNIYPFLNAAEHKRLWDRARGLSPNLVRLLESAKGVQQKRVLLDKHRTDIERLFSQAFSQLSMLDPSFRYPKIITEAKQEPRKPRQPAYLSRWKEGKHPRGFHGYFTTTPPVSTRVGPTSKKVAIYRNLMFFPITPERRDASRNVNWQGVRRRAEEVLLLQAEARDARFTEYMRRAFPRDVARTDSIRAASVRKARKKLNASVAGGVK